MSLFTGCEWKIDVRPGGKVSVNPSAIRSSHSGTFADKRHAASYPSLMRFFILGNGSKPFVAESAERLAASIVSAGGEVAVLDLARQADLSSVEADVALVLGGDGAILRTARQMAFKQVPVLGVNLGRLGFLADLTLDEAIEYLPSVLHRQFQLAEHVMFTCSVDNDGKTKEILGLNEVVVRAGPPFKMLDLELAIDGDVVARFLGDGMIVSTPVGSTAHSLSAGGPVLGQELSAFVITPICGHTLTSRPLVDSADKTYTIRVRQDEGAWLVVDGQDCGPLQPGDRVTVRRAPVAFRLVKVPGKTYYQTLREKLRWGTPPHYRNELELS